MIQLEVERRENEEIAAGAIMSAGGIAGALTTALWGGFGRNNGYYFAMIILLQVSSRYCRRFSIIFWGGAAC